MADPTPQEVIEPYLLPGESLLWAGRCLRPKLWHILRLAVFVTFLVPATLGPLVSAGPYKGLLFLAPAAYTLATLILGILALSATDSWALAPSATYAITDQRVLFATKKELQVVLLLEHIHSVRISGEVVGNVHFKWPRDRSILKDIKGAALFTTLHPFRMLSVNIPEVRRVLQSLEASGKIVLVPPSSRIQTPAT